jgi:hypothetical protein
MEILNSKSYSNFVQNYLFLICILVFVVVYIIINYDSIMTVNIWSGNYLKSGLITTIIILIMYLFIDDDENTNDTLKINNAILNNKYKIINKSNINNGSVNLKDRISILENTINRDQNSIFISQQHKKFGLNF